MRYQVRFPLETSKKVSVFDLHDSSEPDRKKVLTLLPPGIPLKDPVKVAERIDARIHLQHPCLIPILDLAYRGKHPGLVTERIESPSIEEMIGTINYRDARNISLRLASLLDQLHRRGLPAGYLNPRKIFINTDMHPILNLMIPGIPREPSIITSYSESYSAPEFLETGIPTPEADRYSLGMIMFSLFTGIRPRGEELPKPGKVIIPSAVSNLNPQVSNRISSLISSLLHPSPVDRPPLSRLLKAFKNEMPEFESSPIALDSGITGREKEIRSFTELLKERNTGTEIILITGRKGIGKSRLFHHFQLLARLNGFIIHSPGQRNIPPEESANGFDNSRCLVPVSIEDPDEIPESPFHCMREAARRLILVESPEPAEIQRIREIVEESSDSVNVHLFNLGPLGKQDYQNLLESLPGKGSTGLNIETTPWIFQGNPGFVSLLLSALRESGELRWKDGDWVCCPGKILINEIPERIRSILLDILDTQPKEQMTILNILALNGGNMNSCLFKDVIRERISHPEWYLKQLYDLDLVESKVKNGREQLGISHPWISETVKNSLTDREKSSLHRKIGSALEKIYRLRQDPETARQACMHFLKSPCREKAGRYLGPAFNCLTRNSCCQDALELFESAVGAGKISLSIPENWITYIKLLLKTGNEKTCREFVAIAPGFTLNKTILFRLGCILDSLDLDPEDICPHLSSSLNEISPQTTCMELLKTSSSPDFSFFSKPQPIYGRAGETAFQGKGRRCHQIYRMHLAQGHPERAFNHEIKAFRLSLALGKKPAASRRLLNLAHLRLLEDRRNQSRRWLEYCRQISLETGDMRTRLETEILLTVFDRMDGRHRKAENELIRIERLNNHFCTSRRIGLMVLLEWSRNLMHREKFDEAAEKISEVKRISNQQNDQQLSADILMVEARIWASRGFHARAHGLLDEFLVLAGAKHHSLVARERILRARFFLDQGNLAQAGSYIEKLISGKAFLSPCKLAKTRIIQSEFCLLQKQYSKAEACINDSLKTCRENMLLPQLIESYIQKSRWLLEMNQSSLAGTYSLLALKLALKTDRPELERSAELVRKMARKTPPSLFLEESTRDQSFHNIPEDSYGYGVKHERLSSVSTKNSPRDYQPAHPGEIRLSDERSIIGKSTGMKELLKRLLSIADTDTTVLLQGESGTGKELMARALHEYSGRKDKPFVPVNCSTLPADLVENELFGHVRGSYTGADTTSSGLFESASGGTIFLDEISTLPLALQPRLLRVLASKKIRPLGSSREKDINVRIVAATNQDLWSLVQNRLFREDLYFRLNAVRIDIPPLRKRKGDIPAICSDHIANHSDKNDRKLSDQALRRLGDYDYPGNVRELLNILENLLCFSPPGIISADEVDRFTQQNRHWPGQAESSGIIDVVLKELTQGKTTFWDGVRRPFINRDINRDQVRDIVSGGLKKCGGSYKDLLSLFGLEKGEYKKFLSFLEHHDCKVDFREFRPVKKER